MNDNDVCAYFDCIYSDGCNVSECDECIRNGRRSCSDCVYFGLPYCPDLGGSEDESGISLMILGI